MFENFGKLVKELEKIRKPHLPLKRLPPGEYAGKEGVPAVREPGSGLKNSTGAWRVFKPVLVQEKCTNCGVCWLFCPDSAIRLGEKHPSFDYSICKGCLICANECPFKAITAVRDEHE